MEQKKTFLNTWCSQKDQIYTRTESVHIMQSWKTRLKQMWVAVQLSWMPRDLSKGQNVVMLTVPCYARNLLR